MIPIPKNKRGDLYDSNNYRAIAMGSLLCKIFDCIILTVSSRSFRSDDLQFGFKENHSTIMCTSLIIDTVNYYKSQHSNVYMLLLDATKAFDKINHLKLFVKLKARNICPVVLRLLMVMYMNQSMSIKWNNILSTHFSVSNGVKQGGVASPILFNVYINDLLECLRHDGHGCHIGHLYMGAFCYADDLALLSPTLYGLKRSIAISQEYANDYDITFNPKKSKLMCFNHANNIINPCIYVGNDKVQVVNEEKHLGNTLFTDIAKRDMIGTVRDLYMRTNILLSDFTHTDSVTLSQLFNTYCMNVYGSQLWDYGAS
jgi:hypothetical protein